ncbi:31946_t:CDS:1 [Racocetra persica]|uniref:31946_t:CDS:1 n=1 Tax=Racocetra persica TaxID=160502 RepID=A0ACA9PSE2_9GLOM|nr:31946_t:CDS:1 [Racocetra persica]
MNIQMPPKTNNLLTYRYNTTKACNSCRHLKTRCVKEHLDQSDKCRVCIKRNYVCTYPHSTKKRGRRPKKGNTNNKRVVITPPYNNEPSTFNNERFTHPFDNDPTTPPFDNKPTTSPSDNTPTTSPSDNKPSTPSSSNELYIFQELISGEINLDSNLFKKKQS